MSATLIIGGTSGLGLSLARLSKLDGPVYVTGRKTLDESGIIFHQLILDGDNYKEGIDQMFSALPVIDCLIYAAGFFQEGTITDLSSVDIDIMAQVGLLAPIYLIRQLLIQQGDLNEFVVVTSTSEWTPRLLEPVYTATKAGLAMFAQSLSLDSRIAKTLVAAPSGMRTRFWDKDGRDTSEMLDPDWVAGEIMGQLSVGDSFRHIAILRGPMRVEVRNLRT